ncbi:MAG: DUF58 domain-containing protein, partial [Leptospiraceae bacterium]|nr:DUF58 domain-containing protein [Leptospiraceae bacterium]
TVPEIRIYALYFRTAVYLAWAVVFSIALFTPVKPWAWYYNLGMLAFSLLGCVTIPFAVWIFLYWRKGSVREYYLSSGHLYHAGAEDQSQSVADRLFDGLVEWPRPIRWLEYYYPFTLAGTILFASAVLLLGLAFGGTGERVNIYALIFSALSFLVLGLLVLDGRIQAFFVLAVELGWDTSSPLIARLDSAIRVHLAQSRTHYFYRYHFGLIGRLHAGRDASMYIRAEGSSSQGGEIHLPVYLPLCGPMDARGKLMIKDVFGLTRARVGPLMHHRFTVLAPTFPGKQPIVFRNTSALESTRRMHNADEEKYYMREYIPGDRLKDINWKASFKFFELITRISPKSPEESKLLHVEFRNFHSGDTDTMRSILHLNYLKSWVLSFLVQAKRDHPEFQFQVFTADDSRILESAEDIDQFARELAGMPYRRMSHYTHALPPTQEKFIFTTPYDSGLAQSLAGQGRTLVHVFRTAFGTSGQARLVKLLPAEKDNPWPGFWVFRKDRTAAAAGGIAPGSSIIEEKLRVRLI